MSALTQALKAAKRAKLKRVRSNVTESAPGTGANMNPGGTEAQLGSQAYHDAHKRLIQNEAGQSIAGEELGLLQVPGAAPERPGFWTKDGKNFENMGSEYRAFDTPGKDMDQAMDLMTNYNRAITAQDGGAPTSLHKGLVDDDYSLGSVMMPEGSDAAQINRQLTGAGMSGDDVFISPQEAGVNVGQTWPQGAGQQQQMLDAIPGSVPYKRSEAANAYRGGAGGGDWRSAAQELGGVADQFEKANELPALDRMLLRSAGEAPGAYQSMESITKSPVNPNMKKAFEGIINNPQQNPHETLRLMIDDGWISSIEADQVMQLLKQQQPEGLLA